MFKALDALTGPGTTCWNLGWDAGYRAGEYALRPLILRQHQELTELRVRVAELEARMELRPSENP